MNPPSEHRVTRIQFAKAETGASPGAAAFRTHLHQTFNAPSHPIRNRRLRLTADSPDLLAVIKQDGAV